jgi:hypothetical protein
MVSAYTSGSAGVCVCLLTCLSLSSSAPGSWRFGHTRTSTSDERNKSSGRPTERALSLQSSDALHDIPRWLGKASYPGSPTASLSSHHQPQSGIDVFDDSINPLDGLLINSSDFARSFISRKRSSYLGPTRHDQEGLEIQYDIAFVIQHRQEKKRICRK